MYFRNNQEVIDYFQQQHEVEEFDLHFVERFSSYELKESPQELYKLINRYIDEFKGLLFNYMEVDEIKVIYTELEDKIFGDLIICRPTIPNNYCKYLSITKNNQ